MSEVATKKKEEDTTGVRVAVRVRPQLAREKINMCQVCVSVCPGEPQITVGNDKAFTYDYVFDMDTRQVTIYNDCVRCLIEGCFEGYNATVFAYGQTGSGKTYSMGTGFEVDGDEEQVGIIPRAVGHLFNGIEERRQTARQNCEPLPEFKVNAQFMELYNEEVLDLLDTTKDPEARTKKSNIKIHEDAEGGIYVVGVTTRPVSSLNDTIECLKLGALSRATASTNMNAQSSRSHAIFTLHIRQQRMVKNIEEDKDEDCTQPVEFETLTAKFHFVDLAGSERLKRTGATGDRAKEGISINCGLLALGNVISALGDVTKKSSHVPYRDSKITRLLQDSLGGNSRTLMIACVSPSDRDFVETLNTLKYANRARNIKNKVVSNQDKTSKQLAALRSEIGVLQQELIEYKQGKRVVDGDGVSDMFHENTMLQAENNKLRTRIKAMYETVDTVKARNSQLLLQVEAYKLTGGTALEIGNEEVSKVLEEYIKQTEDLRTKLAESETQCEVMQRAASRSPIRGALSPLSRSISAVPITSSVDLPLSPDHNVAHLLEAAKTDIKKMKKSRKMQSSKHSEAGSDKENLSDDDREGEEREDVNGDGAMEDSDLEEDEDIEEAEDEDSSSTDEEDQDSDNIHEDLAELTCEISIKQKLIDELELSQKRLHSLRFQYEEKLTQLQAKIRETEVERDTVLANLGQLESTSADKAKKIREQFEKKLNDLQNEAKKMQAAKKEHAKLVKNQSHYEKQLKTLQHELSEMKKTKVRLIKQIKDDSDKNRQSELKRSKEVAQLKKDQRLKENKIRTLEADKRQKETVLRRKQEEVDSLRKRQVPMSQKAAGRVGKYKPPPSRVMGPISSSTPLKRRRNGNFGFSAKMAKQKWDQIEKNIGSVITRKQTISHMEKDMENWLKHREKLGKKLEKLVLKREASPEETNENKLKDLNDMVDAVKTQIAYAQENISECQNHIMQMEEAKEDAENVDVTSLVKTCTMEEARYLINHLVDLAIAKGMAVSHKDSENRELCAKLHQSELNNTLQQDLLRHMMADQVDIEVDNLLTNNDETESTTSSTSSSPVDSMLESQSAPLPPPRIGIIPASEKTRKEKARRKTATPQELLFSGAPDATMTGLPLAPLIQSSPPVDHAFKEPKDIKKTNGLTETNNNHSAPPKTLALKPATRLNNTSLLPVKNEKLDTVPAVKMRSSTDSLSSSDRNSLELPNSRESTPPTSPIGLRRSFRGNNVFSRLTNSNPSSPHPNRGSITPTGSPKTVPSRLSPLVCTHTAEGHTKAVLSVYATEHMLFTSSKDRTAKAWDLQTGKELLSFPGHPNNVVCVKYNEEKQMAFTVCQNCISVWDTRENPVQCLKTLNSSGLTSDSWMVRGGGRQLGIPSGENPINDIALNSDGNTLYSASGNIVRSWDLRKFKLAGKLNGGHSAPVMVLALDEGESKDFLVTGSKDHYIKVFEVPNDGSGVFTPKYNLEPPHYDGIQSLAIHGHTLFSGSRDTCIKKWDLSTQQLKQSMNSAHKDWICALALLPSSNVLLSGCRGGYLKVWNVDSCNLEGEVKAHSRPINDIATNSTSIFTASNDNTVAIWRQKSSVDPSDSSDVADDRSSGS